MATRTVQNVFSFDLFKTNNRVLVQTEKGVACRVSASATIGTWSDAGAVLHIKRFILGVGVRAFTSAKSIAAGGAADVLIASSEMEAVTALEISLGGIEVAQAYCNITIIQEAASVVNETGA